MATSGSPIQALLLASALWLCLVRAIDGGNIVEIRGRNGWYYVPDTFVDYQAWISSQRLTVTDFLVFRTVSVEPDYKNAVKQVTREAAESCDVSDGADPKELSDPRTGFKFFGYNLSSASELFFSGQLAFVNPSFCDAGMRFVVPGPEKDHQKRTWIAGVTVGVSAALAVLLVAAILHRRSSWHRLSKLNGRQEVDLSYNSSFDSHSKHVEAVDVDWAWAPQRFSYKKLKEATDSFNSSLVVGEGGFGTVYKGYLGESPQCPVAVKRLSQYARQGAREFMAEVNIISQLRHRNLVQLLGWCDENEELILVYEYMPNGDVDDLIFGQDIMTLDGVKASPPLSWKHRYNIFCGVATALVYLHEEWEQRVIHRDVKTSNVMLDGQFSARLGDFGLARLSAHSQAPRTTMVAGTIGYLAPEFSLTGRATDKTDVYAFGIVVLEIASARRPLTANCILLDWVWDLYKEEKLLEAIDPKLALKDITEAEEMKLALRVGLLCCHPDPVARPTMRDVLNILTNKTPLPKMPRSKPVAIFAED